MRKDFAGDVTENLSGNTCNPEDGGSFILSMRKGYGNPRRYEELFS